VTHPRIALGTEIGNSTASLITGRSGTGQALRTTIPSGINGGVDWLTTNNDGGGSGRWFGTSNTTSGDTTAQRRTIIGQFYFRISSGFLPTDVGNKWWEYWNFGASLRSQWGVTRSHSFTGAHSGKFLFHLNPNSGTHSGHQPAGPYWDGDLNDGAWHRWTHRRKPNTTAGSPSSRDGIEQVWIDGVLVASIRSAHIGVTPSGGVKEWCSAADVDRITTDGISYYAFPAYHNATIPLSGTIDHDDMIWWEE
jgi:hypothetical protein